MKFHQQVGEARAMTKSLRCLVEVTANALRHGSSADQFVWFSAGVARCKGGRAWLMS